MMIPFEAPTLVVFTRAPILGTVKTRLAESIGAATALAVHRSCLARAVALASADPQWVGCLAVAPDTAAPGPDGEPPSWAGGLPSFPQGDGDLGERMMRMLTRASGSAPVVLMGSDIPGAAPKHIARAFAALRDDRLVFGPSEDGGFWLVGAAVPPPPDLFADVRWSTAHALSDVTARLPQDGWRTVDTLWDVDEPADYARYLAMAAPDTTIGDLKPPPEPSAATD
ncbi:MAG: TIGR04282 family arsenosugar biosynthesis glycosyltransferase [Thalassobaculaceae bacterium]|uniref:TIGR04282 family arsenosugar biosynthesis glycosyltransferase n=1 Tax=Roseitalea porphyridii TaxID=1852022 RepID=UPI0032EDF699